MENKTTEDFPEYTYRDFLEMAYLNAPQELAGKILGVLAAAITYEALETEKRFAKYNHLAELKSQIQSQILAADIPAVPAKASQPEEDPITDSEVGSEAIFEAILQEPAPALPEVAPETDEETAEPVIPADVEAAIDAAQQSWGIATANGLICRAKDTPDLSNGKKPVWAWAALTIAAATDRAGITRPAKFLEKKAGTEGAAPEDVQEVLAFADLRLKLLAAA